MKEIVTGIIANVDAGKTTLSEALLYETGALRNLGRVDKGDAHLDTASLEKQRGITIFSHQTKLTTGNTSLNLLDTPGHLDFIEETEAVLAVLDYAIMVIAAPDKLSQQTKTLWKLLAHYQVPTFIFVNKIDASTESQASILARLKAELAEGCLAFSQPDLEEVALQDEATLSQFLETGTVSDSQILDLIAKRQVFPVYFGAALKLRGIKDFLAGLDQWTKVNQAPTDLSLRVFKISHDTQGQRLTWVRMYGGSLQPKDVLFGEKLNQIRVYDGAKFELRPKLTAGQVAALTGLTKTYPGQALRIENTQPVMKPVLSYQVDLKGHDIHEVLPALKLLEDEHPQIQVSWSSQLQRLAVQVMGEIQLEVLQALLKERFNLEVGFDQGSILYQETITAPVEGVGHFEPLRHYAEAHIYLEPNPNAGLSFASDCSLELLASNYQSQIMTALKQKEHKGVLIGAALTDVKLTLVGGKAHLKHTEGGDFREATSRAVRQGLMELRQRGNCQLLEPWYDFVIEVNQDLIGKVMTDISRLAGKLDSTKSKGNILVGKAPVATMRSYPTSLRSLSHGEGLIELSFAGYYPCHNQAEVLAASDYQPESDGDNTPQSVFCSHGAGHTVNWQAVPQTMHCPYYRWQVD